MCRRRRVAPLSRPAGRRAAPGWRIGRIARWIGIGSLALGLTGCLPFDGGRTAIVPGRSVAPPAPAGPAIAPVAVPAATPAPIQLATAGAKPIRLGLLCDRTGATANLGNAYCDAIADVVTLVNETGGIRGRPVELVEEDHVADAVTAAELWGRFMRRENVSAAIVFGNTAAHALTPLADRVPVLTFGFGPSAAVNGRTHPFHFQGSACAQCQALDLLAAIARDRAERPADRPARLLYLHDGSALALDPLGTVIDQSPRFGFEFAGSLGIDPRAKDLAPALAAIRPGSADLALVNVFGRPAGLILQANQKLGLGLTLYGFPWATSQDEFSVAGAAAEGYRGLQITALAADNPAGLAEMRAYWQARNLPAGRWVGHAFYDRGIAAGRLAIEALRMADDPDDGPSVARGFESLRDFTAGGYLPSITFTRDDHGGTRAVRLAEIRDQRLVSIGDWLTGPPPADYPDLRRLGW